MATVVKDLGAVTAYAYAVAGGYSGTEAEFEALLGNIAEDLSEIENLSVTVTTLPAGSSATASYSNGVLSLGIPKGDKGDKGDTGATGATGPTGNGISTITKTGTSGLVDTYTITFTNGDTTTFTVTNGEDGEVTTAQMNAAIETALEDYAKVDGSYSSLTAGNAEQLVSTVGVNDKTPYLFRTTGGSADVGDRVKLSEITGGTVAWNQLNALNAVNIPSPSIHTNLSITKNADNSVTISGTSGNAQAYPSLSDISMAVIASHVYLLTTGDYANDGGVRFYWNDSAKVIPVGKKYAFYKNIANPSATNVFVRSVIPANTEVNVTAKVMLFDLTAMFGSTIADYIYSLEQNTAGAGVAWFRKLFPKDYYAYDAGSLLSVKTSAHKEVGFNQWDEEWDEGAINVDTGENYNQSGRVRVKNYIPILPNTTYYKKSPNPGMYWHIYYDADKNWVGKAGIAYNTTFTTPANAYYMRSYTENGYGATYKNDICINLHWDGERDGEYEPYEANTYPLDDVELRGIPKLDASNNLYYDGDGYAPDGTVTRRYGVVDLGTLNWAYQTQAQLATPRFVAALSVQASTATYWVSNALLSSGKYKRGSNVGQHDVDMEYGIATTNGISSIFITDSGYTDAATFKTAMSGVYLIYELSTPTTESADPYQETQICNDFGTEEFVDERTVPMPVGNSALYQANLRAKLEMAPDSPDGDGDYIVRQTDGLNEYVAVSDNATISGLSTRCPACPADTDGTFVLKATVSSGAVTYAWTAES